MMQQRRTIHTSARFKAKVPAFTLLELLIATVLGSILLLTASALFMTFMIGNANTNARRQMSAEGVQMLGTLEFHIRNAKSAVCSGSTLTLTRLDNSQASACFSGSPIKLNFNSTSATCSTNPLNSNFVLVAGSSSFSCTAAANGKQTVQVNFTLSTTEGGGITESFSRIIQLRNS